MNLVSCRKQNKVAGREEIGFWGINAVVCWRLEPGQASVGRFKAGCGDRAGHEWSSGTGWPVESRPAAEAQRWDVLETEAPRGQRAEVSGECGPCGRGGEDGGGVPRGK